MNILKKNLKNIYYKFNTRDTFNNIYFIGIKYFLKDLMQNLKNYYNNRVKT